VGDVSSPKTIPSTSVTTYLRTAIDRNLKFLKQSGLSGPVVIGIAMVNVENHTLAVGGIFNFLHTAVADRNLLILPEVWIDSLETFSDIDEVVKPMMDILWQSFGVYRYFDCTEEGMWNSRRL
jgi:hypothetical protein